MRAVKFNLKGKTAFFKKPDVNTYLYFSYGNIHKVALLGVLGAILGLDGYNSQGDKMYPEFYEKLKDLRIAIVPKCEKGILSKKVQTFNNSVGYASQEEGGNLIIREQWLENPEWDIYVLVEANTIVKELGHRLINKDYVYIPYLGKNDHYASIEGVEIIELSPAENASKVDSLFIKRYFNFIAEDFLSMDNLEAEESWKYEERLPIGLEEVANQYITESFILTNMKVEPLEKSMIYNYNDKILFFF